MVIDTDSVSHFSLAVAVTALTAFLLAAASTTRSALAVIVAVAGPSEIALACFCGAIARAPCATTEADPMPTLIALAEVLLLAAVDAPATIAMTAEHEPEAVEAPAPPAFCTRTPTAAHVLVPDEAAAAPAVRFAEPAKAEVAAAPADPSLTISPAAVLAELDEAAAWPVLRKPPKAVALLDALLDALAAKVVTALQEPTAEALTAAAPS